MRIDANKSDIFFFSIISMPNDSSNYDNHTARATALGAHDNIINIYKQIELIESNVIVVTVVRHIWLD